MAVRLNKVAREFNVGLSTIVEFLHAKGIQVSSDPNAKLSDEDYALVAKEFSSDSEVKKESSMVDLKNSRKKKETVTIDNKGNIKEINEEEQFISIKDEVKLENKIKVVDRIDLNPAQKPVKEEVKEKNATETEEVTAREEAAGKQEKPVRETDATVNTPHVSEEEEPFKIKQPAVKDVKVVGTIDLDSINQRTRPPKKSKLEKERDRKDLKKATTPGKPTGNTEGSGEFLSEEDSETRKKRKRIHRDEPVNLQESDRFGSRNEDNKKKLKKLKKKKQEKTEITDEDVDRQIKDTFARLGSKGK